MNEFTLLTKEQVFGDEKLEVIEKKGTLCAISDFAILLGAYVSYDYHVDDNSSLKGRTGWWYLSSSDGAGNVRCVNEGGGHGCAYAGERYGAVRPALSYSNISDISPNGVRGRSGFLEVEYGEYPQYAVDSRLGRTLDYEFSSGRLRKTGKTYTTDSRLWDDRSNSFKAREHHEYEYNGKRYVRVKSNCYENGHKLSNGVNVMPNDIVWLEVSPITWYVDEKEKILVSKTCLVSGIRFCNRGQYRDDFNNTEMYMFLNTYFAKDIMTTKLQIKKSAEELTLKLLKTNFDIYHKNNDKDTLLTLAMSTFNKDSKVIKELERIYGISNSDKDIYDLLAKIDEFVKSYKK